MVSQANQVAIVIVDNLVGNRQHVSSQPLLVSPNVSIALPFPCPSSFAHPPPSRFAACPSSPSWRPFSCVDPRGIICLSVAPSQLGSCDSTHLAAHRLANSSSQGALPISLPLVRPTIDPVLCQLAPRPTADQLVPRPSPYGEGLAPPQLSVLSSALALLVPLALCPLAKGSMRIVRLYMTGISYESLPLNIPTSINLCSMVIK